MHVYKWQNEEEEEKQQLQHRGYQADSEAEKKYSEKEN